MNQPNYLSSTSSVGYSQVPGSSFTYVGRPYASYKYPVSPPSWKWWSQPPYASGWGVYYQNRARANNYLMPIIGRNSGEIWSNGYVSEQ